MTSQAKKSNLWGEYGKRFTNGHATLTTAQMNALTELLASEVSKRKNFELLKDKMVRPRDPLAGDATPRTENGDVVLNPNAHGSVANGVPLFNPNRPPRIVPQKEWAQGSIGANHAKYQILGNLNQETAETKDLYVHAQEELLRKSTMAAEQRELSESKRRAAAQRQQRLLAQQVETLRLISTQKTSEIKLLTTKFGRDED